MNSVKKSGVWDLDVIISETHRVCFDSEVTIQEAMKMYMNDVYEDVIDIKNTQVQSVLGGE